MTIDIGTGNEDLLGVVTKIANEDDGVRDLIGTDDDSETGTASISGFHLTLHTATFEGTIGREPRTSERVGDRQGLASPGGVDDEGVEVMGNC